MATPIAGIVELTDTQPGKFLDHNKALRHIEALAIGAVEDTLNTPPTTFTLGQTWIVGTSPTGAWSGQNNKIAQRTDTGWQFYSVFAGLAVANKTIEGFSYFNGTTWQEITSNAANLTVTDGTTTVNNTDTITIAGANITDQGSGDVLLTIPASLTASDGTTTVNGVDNILFNGATLTNNGSGDIEVDIETLSVTKGATTINNVSSLILTGSATPVDNGGGIVSLDVGKSLSVIQGATTANLVDQITFTGNATLTDNGSGDVTVNIPSSTFNLSVTNGTTTLTNRSTLSFPSATITDGGSGIAQVTLTTSLVAFNTSQTITLPYTISLADQNKELVVVNGTGDFFIPATTNTFPVGYQVILSLDGTGNINIQRTGNTYNNLIFSGGETRLKTQGSVTLIHRGLSVWKVIGYLQA